MLKMWNNFKFEYILALGILFCLLLSLIGAFLIGDINLITMIIGAFIGSMGSIMAFFFTKHIPGKDDTKEP